MQSVFVFLSLSFLCSVFLCVSPLLTVSLSLSLPDACLCFCLSLMLFSYGSLTFLCECVCVTQLSVKGRSSTKSVPPSCHFKKCICYIIIFKNCQLTWFDFVVVVFLSSSFLRLLHRDHDFCSSTFLSFYKQSCSWHSNQRQRHEKD